jgi:hypothetical protein
MSDAYGRPHRYFCARPWARGRGEDQDMLRARFFDDDERRREIDRLLESLDAASATPQSVLFPSDATAPSTSPSSACTAMSAQHLASAAWSRWSQLSLVASGAHQRTARRHRRRGALDAMRSSDLMSSSLTMGAASCREPPCRCKYNDKASRSPGGEPAGGAGMAHVQVQPKVGRAAHMRRLDATEAVGSSWKTRQALRLVQAPHRHRRRAGHRRATDAVSGLSRDSDTKKWAATTTKSRPPSRPRAR